MARSPAYLVDCGFCDGEGYVHECGEDTCSCADKSGNTRCPECRGEGTIAIEAECPWDTREEYEGIR